MTGAPHTACTVRECTHIYAVCSSGCTLHALGRQHVFIHMHAGHARQGGAGTAAEYGSAMQRHWPMSSALHPALLCPRVTFLLLHLPFAPESCAKASADIIELAFPRLRIHDHGPADSLLPYLDQVVTLRCGQKVVVDELGIWQQGGTSSMRVHRHVSQMGSGNSTMINARCMHGTLTARGAHEMVSTLQPAHRGEGASTSISAGGENCSGVVLGTTCCCSLGLHIP